MSPRPARIRRRMARRVIRAPIRRNIRRLRRIMWRTTRRLIIGTSVILLIGGSYAIYKLNKNDVQRVENEIGKPAENLTEDELKVTMKKLGIKKLELTTDDELVISKAEEDIDKPLSSGKNFCTFCGAKIDKDSKYCSNCGQEI